MKANYRGKIMIRKGNENQEPTVVYVSHWSENFAWWVTPVINGGDILFSTNDDLISFNYKKFQQLYYQWKIDNQQKVTENFKELLKEWQ